MNRWHLFAPQEREITERQVVGTLDDVHVGYRAIKMMVPADVEDGVGTAELWQHLISRLLGAFSQGPSHCFDIFDGNPLT